MPMTKEQHQCFSMPKAFKIVKSPTENKWVIAKVDGDYISACETLVWKINFCPFCGEKLG